MKSVARFAASLLLLSPSLVRADAASDRAALVAFSSDLKSMLSWGEKSINESYMPTSKVGRDFAKRCGETEKALREAPSINDAYALISDCLCSVDPRIRFYPPARAVRVDYGWKWGLIGNAAYVDQVDRVGAASEQGLKVGDKVLEIEGIPVTRDTYQQVYYVFTDLAPRPGLRVLVQSPAGEPRLLALTSTIRERRRFRQTGSARINLERERSVTGQKSYDDFFDVSRHVRRVGTVGYWNAEELHRDTIAVGQAFKQLDGVSALIIDLRGHYVIESETVVRALEQLFTRALDLGRIERDGPDISLRVKGRSDALPGTVLVMMNAETAGYAELLAHVIQHEQRGALVGDRTMGRVFEPKLLHQVTRNQTASGYVAGLTVPAGELILTDNTAIDGHGVAPDFQIWPTPADLAAHRDVALSKAFAQLKQTVTPEDAYAFRPHYADEDDDY